MDKKIQKFSTSLRNAFGIENDDYIDFSGEYGIDNKVISVSTIKELPVPAPENFARMFREELGLNLELVAVILRFGSVRDLDEAITQADHDGSDRDSYLESAIDDILDRNNSFISDDEFSVEDIELLDDDFQDNPVDDVDEDLILMDGQGRFASFEAGADILDMDYYSLLRHQIISMSVFGDVPSATEPVPYSVPVFGTMITTLMSTVNSRATHAVVTIASADAEGRAHAMSSGVEIVDDTVVWEHASVAAAFSDIRVLGTVANVQVRCFDPVETIEIINRPGNGGTMRVPRKTIGSWVLDTDDQTMWLGMSQSQIGQAHSIHPETGDIYVPEEGVDFVSTPNIRRTLSRD